jgi:hypothetical protein
MKYTIRDKQYTLEEAFELFKEDFENLIEKFKRGVDIPDEERHLVYYYRNNLCQSNHDPMDDAYIIEGELYDLGWKGTLLKELFEVYGTDICDALDTTSRGAFDVFLWKFTKGFFPLSGYDMEDLNGPDGHSEVMIKYAYGWSKTKYGKLLLQQNGVDPKEFDIMAAKIFLTEDNYGLYDILFQETVKIKPFKDLKIEDRYGLTKIHKRIEKMCSLDNTSVHIPYVKITDMFNTFALVTLMDDNSSDDEAITYDKMKEKIFNLFVIKKCKKEVVNETIIVTF